MAAGLFELSERVLDQLSDLPPDAFGAVQADTGLCIGALALHLAWAELSWMERLRGEAAPPSLATSVARGNLATLLQCTAAAAPKEAALSPTASAPPTASALPASSAAEPYPANVDDYRRIYASLRDELTLPTLRSIVDIHAEMESKGLRISPAGVMAHLAWHWTYHSGQIGLLRMFAGYDYTWTFDAEVRIGR